VTFSVFESSCHQLLLLPV